MIGLIYTMDANLTFFNKHGGGYFDTINLTATYGMHYLYTFPTQEETFGIHNLRPILPQNGTKKSRIS